MERRKLVAIRTHTLEQWVIRPATMPRSDIPCDHCGSTVWLTVGGAIQLTGLTPQQICQMTGSGQVHSTLGSDGCLLVCCRSLEILKIEKGDKNK